MKKLIIPAVILLLAACTASVPESAGTTAAQPSIFPDYTDITIPSNISPLNFRIMEEADAFVTQLSAGGTEVTLKGEKVIIPLKKWRALTAAGDITVQVYGKKDGKWTAFQPFRMETSDGIDPYISYRRLPISVESYERLAICQRNLTDFKETVIYANQMAQTDTKGQCVNCHSYRNWKPDEMQMHVRQAMGGTLIYRDGILRKVNLKTDSTMSAGFYPAWHPTHDYIAYSNNMVHQSIHIGGHDKLEVLDEASDIVLYNLKTGGVSAIETAPDEMECFPYWSPDGKWLYYVSAHFEAENNPDRRDKVFREAKDIRYNLYRKPFDPDTRVWGPKELVHDAASEGRSMTWPRISPDGRWLVCSMSPFGVFPIHQGATDLCIVDLEDFSLRKIDEVNSNQADDYHAWSSNGKWLMFATRREDGAYTRLYFTHFNGDGTFSKPFALPQHDPDFNREDLMSFNICEFMTGAVDLKPRQLARFIKHTDPEPSIYEEKLQQ